MRALALAAGGVAAVVCGLAAAQPAAAASPSPSADCVAALQQAGTPSGIAQVPPGFLGSFVSGEAHISPGYVGTGSSTAAQSHGDLFQCLPQPGNG